MTETFDVGNIPPQLRESLLHGKAAAEIGWGRDGDFDSCVRFLERHAVPHRMIKGECAELHKEATGFWPGKGREHSCDSEEFADLAEFQALIASAAPETDNRIRWEGPLAPIGTPTGDGRIFPPGRISYQSFPQPFGWQEKSGLGHQGAVTVGVIEHAEEGMWDGKPHIVGRGYFLDPDIIPEVSKALHLIEHGVAGPSVDLDSYTAALDDHMGEKVAAVKKGRMRSATLVRIPAFADLRLKLKYPAGYTRPFDLAPEGADTANVADTATFAVNPHGWKSAPIAPREALFDADDAVKRIQDWSQGDAQKMASAFLWVNTDNGPLLGKEGYRLPWADVVDGKLYLIYHAIYSASALLEDGHGGLPNIPDAEKAKLRSIISEIYAKLADHYGDPHMRASWDAPRNQNTAAAEDVEEFLGRYTERKHPRKPRKAPKGEGGEWTDVPGHGPHGQIKVGGKWIYPDKKTGKVPGHHEQSEHRPAKATVKKAAPKAHEEQAPKAVTKHPLTHEGVVAAHAESDGLGRGDSKLVSLVQIRRRLGGTHEEQTALLKQLDRERKIQLDPEPNRKILNADILKDHVPVGGKKMMYLSVLSRPKKDEGTPEKKDVGVPEKKTAKVTVKKTGDHKLTPAQEKYLKEGSGHPASKKVLQREGYLDEQGNLTQKGKDAGGNAPEVKKTAKVTVKKTAAHKVTPSQDATLRKLHQGGPLSEDTKREGVHPASLKVLEREGYVKKENGHHVLTDKGRNHIGVHVEANPGHETKVPEKKTAKVAVRKVAPKRDTDAIAKKVKDAGSREEVRKHLEGLSRAELVDVAQKVGGVHRAGATKPEIETSIVRQVGVRLDSDALMGNSRFKAPVPSSEKVSAAEKMAARRREISAERTKVRDQLSALDKRISELHNEVGTHLMHGEDPGPARQKLSDAQNEYQRLTKEAARLYGEEKAHTPNPDVIDSNWQAQLNQETGMDPVPVRDLRISYDVSGDYHVKKGFAYKIDGVKYMIEAKTQAEAAKAVEQIRRLHASLGGNSEHAHTFLWLQGANPDDGYWQKKFKASHVSVASNNGKGVTTLYQRGSIDDSDATLQNTLRHELGHTYDHVAQEKGISSGSPAWTLAAQKDAQRPAIHARFASHHGHPVTQISHGDRAYPHGVSTYGKSSPGEDFAESVAQYLSGSLGTGFTVDKQGRQGEQPLYFRDLFPERAKLLDQLFPDVAKKQKAVTVGRFRPGERWVSSGPRS